MSEHFKEKFWDCTDDFKVCLVSACVPGGFCCLQAKAVDKIKNTGTVIPYFLVCSLCCIGGMMNRASIREKLNIKGKLSHDYMLWCCCAPCAACQEYREAKHHKS